MFEDLTQAPPEVKARVMAEFRRHHSRRIPWVAIAATAAIVLLLLPMRQGSVPPAATQIGDLSAFIGLDDSPMEAGLVVRMTVPRSVLGDESAIGEVEADVLLGDDGLAHAVRFVRR